MPVDHQALSERYATALASGDLEIINEVFTEDFVDEYPQSGEIIRGRRNLRAMMEHRPGLTADTGPDLSTVRARASDEHGSWRRCSPWSGSRVGAMRERRRCGPAIRMGPGGGSLSSTSCATVGSPDRRASSPRSSRPRRGEPRSSSGARPRKPRRQAGIDAFLA